MVQSDTDGGPMLLADRYETGEERTRFRVVPVEIARIDPDLFHHSRRGDGRLGGEMDVRHQGRIDAGGAEPVADLPQGLHFRESGNRDPDDFSSGFRHTDALGHSTFHIIRMGIAHGLDHDRVTAADGDFPHMYRPILHRQSVWQSSSAGAGYNPGAA